MADWGGSIREFCALDMPIIMFDKNEDFVIVKLEEVGCFLYICLLVLEAHMFVVASHVVWARPVAASRSAGRSSVMSSSCGPHNHIQVLNRSRSVRRLVGRWVGHGANSWIVASGSVR